MSMGSESCELEAILRYNRIQRFGPRVLLRLMSPCAFHVFVTADRTLVCLWFSCRGEGSLSYSLRGKRRLARAHGFVYIRGPLAEGDGQLSCSLNSVNWYLINPSQYCPDGGGLVWGEKIFGQGWKIPDMEAFRECGAAGWDWSGAPGRNLEIRSVSVM